MHIVMVASEAYPFIKVGGLADVVGSLPKALVKDDPTLRVTVIVPWYRGIDAADFTDMELVFDGESEHAPVGVIDQGAVRFVFVATKNDFNRERAYGYDDDARRFVRFGIAAWQLIKTMKPDVLHLHDWQAGLLAAFVEARELSLPVVMTIHNLAFQGMIAPDDLFNWTGLPRSLHRLDGTEFYGQASLLKTGLAFADRITTVSPSYALEIQTPEQGWGLDGLLRHRSDDLQGILNGIDTDVWNPANDSAIEATFSAADPSGKRACEQALQSELGIDGPVLGIISRFASQKGIDLAAAAAPDLVDLGFSMAVLGSGEDTLEAQWHGLASMHPERIAFEAKYDESLSRRIYAGARGLLIPSRYEPCGLTQMIAMRYGTIPIASARGGLRDSIRDGETGFLFDELTPAALVEAVERFRSADVERLQQAAFKEDFSWSRSATTHLHLYASLSGTGV